MAEVIVRKHNYHFKDDVKHGKRHPKHHIHASKQYLKLERHAKHKDALPNKIDFRNKVLEIYEQGSIGSCVSNAISSAIRMKMQDLNNTRWSIIRSVRGNHVNDATGPARLYIYFHSRIKEGSDISDDCGCMIETALDVINDYKFCNEKLWHYSDDNLTKQPVFGCYLDANSYDKLTIKYTKLEHTIEAIKTALSLEHPVAIGIAVFSSFDNEQNGLIKTPDPQKDKFIGGHCILLVGYNDDKKNFIFLNSWGESWGDKGFGYIMYDYVENQDICGDMYAII